MDEKANGNEAFKRADYLAAIKHYTAALVALQTSAPPHDPSQRAVLCCNRAIAYLKLNKHEDAERDCTKALELQPCNAKALFRRGLARKGLARYEEAINDLYDAQKLESSNTSITTELKEAQRLLEDSNAAAREKKAKAKAVRARAEAKEASPTPVASTSKASVRAESDPTLMREVATRRLPTEKSGFGAAKEARQAREAKQRSTLGIPSPKVPEPAPKASAPRHPSPPPLALSSAPPLPLPAGGDLGIRSAYDFGRAWIEVREQARGRWSPLWTLLSSIEPVQYPRLFATNLEPDLLAEMLQTMREAASQDPSAAERAYAIVTELPKCNRFVFLAMLLADADRDAVRDILQRSGADSDSSLAAVWGL